VLEREHVDRPTFSPAEIRRYYDRNTPAFVRLGHGASVGAIHRAIWGPGVTQREAAFRYVEDRIVEQISPLTAPGVPLQVLDLGCGIGASLCYLATRLPLRGTGITISPVQAELAAQRIHGLGLADRVSVIEGDYTALPSTLADIDAAYAIESFVHGPSPERFFAEAARVLRPGGLLMICDDVRRESRDPRAAKAVAQFQRGWHVNTLLTAAELRDTAATAGFTPVATTDLTPYLDLGRPRDRAIAVLAGIFGALPGMSTRMAPLIGGHALQTCLQRGWIGHDFAVFRR
jgi:ubiquinone/menaquinone biosynthesis C-methylase UbiE